MYTIVYSRSARREMNRLPYNIRARIQARLTHLAENPYARNNNVTKMQNHPGYRLRVGDWRVIYLLEDSQLKIMVARVANRGEVYR